MVRRRNCIEVPRDLAAVSSYDAHAECAPGAADLAPDAVNRIWRAVQAMYRSGLHPGIQIAIRRRGHLVMNRAIGHLHGRVHGQPPSADDRLLTPEAPICLFSASKAVTAMLAHKLVDDGALSLDDRVADYLPEYGVHGKGRTTVRELLAHRAGIPSLPVREVDPALLTDWDTVIRLLCEARPSANPGQQQSYHAVTGGYIVGELVRRVGGRSLPDMLKQTLADPLGCRYLCYGLPRSDRTGMAHSRSTGPKLGFPLNLVAKRALGLAFEDVAPLSTEDAFLSSVVPAANLHATAEEMTRFYQMLLDGGRWEGCTLYRPEIVAEAVRPVGRIQIDRTLLVPVRFSAGFVLGENPFGLYGGRCVRAYGHLGFINIVCWADPDRDISVALLNTGKSMAAESLPHLGRVLWTVARVCKPVLGGRRVH